MHCMPAGVGLCLEDKDGCVKVVKVLKGSSAYAKGIAEGDRLLRVDGVSVKDMSAETVARTLIVGDINSAVRIEIVRENGRFSDVIRTLLFRKVLDSATVEEEYNCYRSLSPQCSTQSQKYESQSSNPSFIDRTDSPESYSPPKPDFGAHTVNMSRISAQHFHANGVPKEVRPSNAYPGKFLHIRGRFASAHISKTIVTQQSMHDPKTLTKTSSSAHLAPSTDTSKTFTVSTIAEQLLEARRMHEATLQNERRFRRRAVTILSRWSLHAALHRESGLERAGRQRRNRYALAAHFAALYAYTLPHSRNARLLQAAWARRLCRLLQSACAEWRALCTPPLDFLDLVFRRCSSERNEQRAHRHLAVLAQRRRGREAALAALSAWANRVALRTRLSALAPVIAHLHKEKAVRDVLRALAGEAAATRDILRCAESLRGAALRRLPQKFLATLRGHLHRPSRRLKAVARFLRSQEEQVGCADQGLALLLVSWCVAAAARRGQRQAQVIRLQALNRRTAATALLAMRAHILRKTYLRAARRGAVLLASRHTAQTALRALRLRVRHCRRVAAAAHCLRRRATAAGFAAFSTGPGIAAACASAQGRGGVWRGLLDQWAGRCWSGLLDDFAAWQSLTSQAGGRRAAELELSMRLRARMVAAALAGLRQGSAHRRARRAADAKCSNFVQVISLRRAGAVLAALMPLVSCTVRARAISAAIRVRHARAVLRALGNATSCARNLELAGVEVLKLVTAGLLSRTWKSWQERVCCWQNIVPVVFRQRQLNLMRFGFCSLLFALRESSGQRAAAEVRALRVEQRELDAAFVCLRFLSVNKSAKRFQKVERLQGLCEKRIKTSTSVGWCRLKSWTLLQQGKMGGKQELHGVIMRRCLAAFRQLVAWGHYSVGLRRRARKLLDTVGSARSHALTRAIRGLARAVAKRAEVRNLKVDLHILATFNFVLQHFDAWMLRTIGGGDACDDRRGFRCLRVAAVRAAEGEIRCCPTTTTGCSIMATSPSCASSASDDTKIACFSAATFKRVETIESFSLNSVASAASSASSAVSTSKIMKKFDDMSERVQQHLLVGKKKCLRKCIHAWHSVVEFRNNKIKCEAQITSKRDQSKIFMFYRSWTSHYLYIKGLHLSESKIKEMSLRLSAKQALKNWYDVARDLAVQISSTMQTCRTVMSKKIAYSFFQEWQETLFLSVYRRKVHTLGLTCLPVSTKRAALTNWVKAVDKRKFHLTYEKHHVSLLMSRVAECSLACLNSVYFRWIRYAWKRRCTSSFVTKVRLTFRNNVFLAWKQHYSIILRFVQCHEHLRLNRNRFLCERLLGSWNLLSNNNSGTLVNQKLAIFKCLERYSLTLLNQIAITWISRNCVLQWACAKALNRTHSIWRAVFLEWVHYVRLQSFFFVNQETIKKYRKNVLLANFILAWHNLIFVFKQIILIASKRKLQLLVGALIVWYRFLRIEVMRGQGEARMCSECFVMWSASVKFEQRIRLLQQLSAVQRNDQILALFAGRWIQQFLIAKRQEIISAEVSRRHIVILIRCAMKGWIVNFQHKQYISLIERKISLFGIGTLLSRILSTWSFSTRMRTKSHVYFDIYSKLARVVHSCISSAFHAWFRWSEKEAYFWEVKQTVAQSNSHKMLSRYLEHFVNAIIKRKFVDHLCAIKQNKTRLLYLHKWVQRITILQNVEKKYEQALRLHGTLCLLEWNEISRRYSDCSTTALKKWLVVIMYSSGSSLTPENSADQELEGADLTQSNSKWLQDTDAVCLKLTEKNEDRVRFVACSNPCVPLIYDNKEFNLLSQDEYAIHHENSTDHGDDSQRHYTDSLEPSVLNHNPWDKEGVRDIEDLHGVKLDSENESVSSLGSLPTQKAFLDWKMNSIQGRFFKTAHKKFSSWRNKNACSVWFLWHEEQRILKAHPSDTAIIVSDSRSDASLINTDNESGVQSVPFSRSVEFCCISQNEQVQSTKILGLEHKYWKSTVLALFLSWKDWINCIQKQAAAAQSQRNFRLLTCTWTHYRMCMRQNHYKELKSCGLSVVPDFAAWFSTRIRVFWGAAVRCNGSISMLELFCLLSWSLVSKHKKQIVCIQNSNKHSNSRRLLDSRFNHWKSSWAEWKRNSKQLISVRNRRIQDSILSAWLEYQLRMVHRVNVATILSNKSTYIRIKTVFIAWKQFLQLLASVSTLIYCQNCKWNYFCYWREIMKVVAVIPDAGGLTIVSHDICLHPYASGTLFNVGDKLSLWTRWEAINYGHGDAPLLRDASDSSELKAGLVLNNETANGESNLQVSPHSDAQNHSDANACASFSLNSESNRKFQKSLNPCVVNKGSESLGLCTSQGASPGTMIDDVKRQRAAQRRAQFLQEQYQVQYQNLVPTYISTDVIEKSMTGPVGHSRLIGIIDSTERSIDGNVSVPKIEQSTSLENNMFDLNNDSRSCMIQDFEVASFSQTVACPKSIETPDQNEALETDQSRINTALQLRKRHLIFIQNIVLLYWQEHALVSQHIKKTLRRINGVLKYKVIVAWMQIRSVQVLSQIARLKHLDEGKMTAFMNWVHFFRIHRSNRSALVSLSQN